MSEFKFPTEMVELPSKGLIYPETNPLSSGVIEMKYMTAKEEDILTNQNYIKDGTVIDRLLKSLIMSKVNYNDLIVGDKNAVMIAARVLGYGKDYTFNFLDKEKTVDLSTMESKYLEEKDLEAKGVNKFSFKLPSTGVVIEYKLLTGNDDIEIRQEIKGLQKINKKASPELSTRLKHMIISFDGNENKKEIREFVDNYMLARDSKSLRDHIRKTQPDINLTFKYERDNGEDGEASIPITTNFFWPDV
tara:strand:- start:15419 stop:16159 length:741 start_codon:yes stop_codon:yes gene_type:complete